MPRTKKTTATVSMAIDEMKTRIVAKEKEIIKLVKRWDVPLMGDGAEEALAVHRARLDLDDLEMHLKLLEDPEPPPKKAQTPKDPQDPPKNELPSSPPAKKKKRGELPKFFNEKKTD